MAPDLRPSAELASVTVEGRLFVDVAALTTMLRSDAGWHELKARIIGDPIPPGREDEVMVLHAVAHRLRERADMIDTACIAHVTAAETTERGADA